MTLRLVDVFDFLFCRYALILNDNDVSFVDFVNIIVFEREKPTCMWISEEYKQFQGAKVFYHKRQFATKYL